jgi:tetratricopeptide (TPR) repeat protein
MRRLPALLIALILPTAQPLLLGAVVSTGTLLVSQAPAQAQTAGAAAKVAQAVTVRIEGATQGSGVLVKREGNRYTVLTAWHVVSGQRPGEELDIYTPDGIRHKATVQSHGEILDLAELAFVSSENYRVAVISEQSGNDQLKAKILVAGYPLGKPLVIGEGESYGFATNPRSRNGGYTLQYWVATDFGMSGGPLLLGDGSLLGIHGESDISTGQKEARRNALAIPIAFYVIAKAEGESLGGDRQAFAQFDMLRTAIDWSVAGYRSQSEGDYSKAVVEFGKAIALEPNWGKHWGDRGIAKAMQGNYEPAIADITRAINLVISGNQDSVGSGNSLLAALYFSRAKCWQLLGRRDLAMSDIVNASKHAKSPHDRKMLGLE